MGVMPSLPFQKQPSAAKKLEKTSAL